MARLSSEKKGEKVARGGKPWTTERQRVWLVGLMDLHMEARHSKKRGAIAAFRRKVMDDFVQEFWKDKKMSADERKEALVTLERRLREWFSNYSRKAGPVRGAKVLDLRGLKKKHLAGWQAYSRLYYDDILKPLVEEKWREHPTYDPKAREVPFEFRNKVVCKLWHLEKDEAVKEEVAAYIEEVYQEGDDVEEEAKPDEDDDDVDAEELSRRQANRKLQSQVEALLLTLQKMCEQIFREVGFVGVACFAGPEPKSGGSIVVAFCDGRTEGGRRLTDVYPALKQQLEAAVCDFADKAISVEKRVACSLPGTESKRDYSVPSISLHTDTPPTTATPSKLAPSRSLSPDAAKHQQALRLLLERSKYRFDGGGDDTSMDEEDPAKAGHDDTPTEDMEVDNDTHGEDGQDNGNVRDGSDDDSNDEAPGDHDSGEGGESNGDDGEATQAEAYNGNEGGEVTQALSEEEIAMNEELDNIIELKALPVRLRKVVQYLRGYKGHVGYVDVIAWFVKFERHVKRNPGKPLAAAGRPTILSEWIRGGRNADKHQKLSAKQLDQMCDELFAWWYSLQPKERIPDDFEKSSQDCSLLVRIDTDSYEDWPELYRGVTNGIHGVLLCLGWWLEAERKPGAKFDNLVDDVCWVLESMLSVPAPPFNAEKPPSRRQ